MEKIGTAYWRIADDRGPDATITRGEIRANEPTGSAS
jgi:hypothetical protein